MIASLCASTLLAHDGEHHDERDYLRDGEIDIAVLYDSADGKLEWAIFAEDEHEEHEELDEHEHDEHEHDEHDEHEHGAQLEWEDVVILAGANTEFTLPANGAFDFLGQPGERHYVLPQNPATGPAAPGFAIEVEPGIFTDDTLTVSLVEVAGPGGIIIYTLDGFGTASVYFDSNDGLDSRDAYSGQAESHQHMAWAFDQPGIYTLTLVASGTLQSDGNTLTSEPATLAFHVGGGLAYLEAIESYEDGWAEAEDLGPVYVDAFPWIYSTLFEGWCYAQGEGGEAMVKYVAALEGWIFTGTELAPWAYRYTEGDWIYILKVSENDSAYWSFADDQWFDL